MPTGTQIRAARVLAGWDAQKLAELSGISRNALTQIERGIYRPRQQTAERIVNAFTGVGIEFIDNDGVRRCPQDIEVFEGHERFNAFSEFIYTHTEKYPTDICIACADDRLHHKFRKEPEIYRERMRKLIEDTGITCRVLVETAFDATYSAVRLWPHQSKVPMSFYAFGQSLALISFVHPRPPYVVLHKFSPFGDGFRQLFEDAWQVAGQIKNL